MLAPEYPIRTERLLLRPLDPASDADAVYAYSSRADVCRYIPFEPRSREEVATWLAARRSSFESEGQALGLAVVRRDTGQLVGDVMLLWVSAEHRRGEIGYVFSPEHRGHGYATEAARALLRLGFDGLGAHRITARIDARNTASARVAERLGMRLEAHLVENEWFKGEWSDELVYAMLDREWQARSMRRS